LWIAEREFTLELLQKAAEPIQNTARFGIIDGEFMQVNLRGLTELLRMEASQEKIMIVKFWI